MRFLNGFFFDGDGEERRDRGTGVPRERAARYLLGD